jgi:crotonobetainyl-CoA:carnitine CoA-transferase CaiB-like acyl-CoA transferase
VKNRALEGVKILEFCATLSGAYCAKLMADFGAEVIKVEPPGTGDRARYLPPFPGDEPHPEKSGLFLYLNTNKKGITLDPEKPKGKKVFLKLAKGTDILVEDQPVGEMDRLGLGYDDLKKTNPGLIMASITPFGRSGPFKHYKSYPLNVAHVSGQGYMLPLASPHRWRPPVKTGGNAGEYDSGLVAVVSILAALFRKGVSGEGQFIELSKQESLISMQRVESVTYANQEVVITRTGGENRMPGGVLPCKDGYVVIITPQEHQWKALMALLGNPGWSRQSWCLDRQRRAKNSEAINQRLIAWTMKHTKEEIFRKGQALSCPVSPCQSAEDIVNSEQLAARGFFAEVEHPVLGRLPFPTTPYRFSESPWRAERPAPCLGEANEDVYCGQLGVSKKELEKLKKEGVI